MTTSPTPTPRRPELLEEDILQALGPIFAPSDAFRERIRRGIEANDELERERAERLKSAPPRLRIAAGLLPPGLLPSGLVLGAGKKLSAKGLAAVLATPAFSFVMVVLTLVAGLRALWQARQAPSKPGDQTDQRQAMSKAWWKRNQRAALLSGAVILLLALLGHPETVLFGILLSTGAAALLLGEFARAGISDVKSVGRWTSGLLWHLGLYGFMLRNALPIGSGASNAYTACAILMIGAALCRIVSGQLTWRRLLDAFDAPVQRLSQRDLPTVICLRGLMGLLTLFLCAGLTLLLAALAFGFVPSKPSRERLVQFARDFEAPVQASSQWELFERAMDLLESDGEALPDLKSATSVIQSAIAGKENIGTAAERSAVRFGLIKDEDLGPLTSSSQARHLLSSSNAALQWDSHGATLKALVRAGALDRATRTGLGDRIEAAWPAPGDARILAELRGRVEMLELLGEGARIESQWQNIRAAISLAWPPTHGGWRPTTAFLWDRASASEGRASQAGSHMISSLWKPTDDALSLAARAGLPPDIDLEPLRRTLATTLQVNRFGQLFGWGDRNSVGVELAALRLERLIPDPAGNSWTATLVNSRLLLAVLGLVTLCVLASTHKHQDAASS